MQHVGEMDFVLGLGMAQNTCNVPLHIHIYIHMINCGSVIYIEVVGCLLWLACGSCPDIDYIVGQFVWE